MKHQRLSNKAGYDPANLRAEDGFEAEDRRRRLQTAILAPVFVFAIIAIIILLLSHFAFGQAASS